MLGLVLYYNNEQFGHAVSPAFSLKMPKFQPLDVQEPRLHTDRFRQKLRKLQYSGNASEHFRRRSEPAPSAQPRPAGRKLRGLCGPEPPPPPPPLQVPAEFFGYETRLAFGSRAAFFSSGDDVLVVAEGDTFLSRFRLIRIGNDTADVEEIAHRRRSTVTMVQPPATTGAQ